MRYVKSPCRRRATFFLCLSADVMRPSETHCRPNPYLHIWSRQSNHWYSLSSCSAVISSLLFPSLTCSCTAGKDQDVKAGDLIIVPAGTQHQFINTGPTPLILYTVYSPAEHKPTTVHKTKEQGDKEEDEGIDVPPEWAGRSKAENEKLGLVEGE